MKIEKMAALANVIALAPGAYCAYASWVLLHPATAVSSPPAAQSPVNLTAVLVSLLSAVGLVILAAILNTVAAYGNKTAQQSTQTATDWREAFRNPQWKIVSGHTFHNEAVVIDGRSFRNCRFVNAELVFHGTAPAELTGDSQIEESLELSSDDPAVILYGKFHRALQSIPRARFEQGAVDGKGNLVADKFNISEVEPAETPEYQSLTAEQALAVEINRMSPSELEARLKSDPAFAKRVNAIAMPSIKTRSLERRAFSVATNIRYLLKQHGPEPAVDGCKAHGIEPMDWFYKMIAPWRDRVNGGFKARILDDAQRVRDELAERNLPDSQLNQLIMQQIQTEESLNAMADKFRYLAAKLGD